MAQLIASGITQEDSEDFTVVAGTPNTLFITGLVDGPVSSGMRFLLQYKTSGGVYNTVAHLNINNIQQLGVIAGSGTFRVRRLASVWQDDQGCGMDIE